MAKLMIGIEHLEASTNINKHLLNVLETYIKKTGEWNGEMIAQMTSAREAVETQQELITTMIKANSLANS